MKYFFAILISLTINPLAHSYSGSDVYESCRRYEQQRTPGIEPTREDALQVGMCLGMSKGIYEMLTLSDSTSTGICLPENDLSPRDVALMFLRRMEGRELAELTATQAIIGAFIAEYPCKGLKR